MTPMTDTSFRRVVLPLASIKDAKTTSESVLPYLREVNGNVLAVHVIEKAGGAPDKASVEQREIRAREIFAVIEETLADEGIPVETEILYGTDVAESIIDTATEFDASAVVFTPRGGSRWVKLLTGDTARGLIQNADRPIVVLPEVDKEGEGG